MQLNQKELPKVTNNYFRNQQAFTTFLVLSFFVLSLIGILNHEMWRDETQAWLIARDSLTLSDLYENLKFEGHPALWHLCLFIITKFTHNPFAMQFFHILIATAIVWIFVKLSPFNILQKALFTFSYFPFFEYNLISRNYSLGLLFVFIFCYLFTSKKRNYILLFSSLALLANTNVYGLLICLCSSATLIIDTIRIYRIDKSQLNRKQIKNLKMGLIVLCLGIGLSLFQLAPLAIQDTAKDINDNIGEIGEETVVSKFDFLLTMLRRLGYSLRAIWYSYIPIPNFFEYHFWSQNLVSISSFLILLSSFASLFLLIFSIILFLDKPIVLFLYLSGNFTIILFTWLKWQGTLRHHGNLFILFLACIWISKFSEKAYDVPRSLQKISAYFKKFQKKIITAILLIQMVSGLYAYSMDLIYPFSKSRIAANFIKKEQLSEKFIIGDRDTIISPISAYLDKKIYYVAYDQLGSFFNNPQIKFIKNQSQLINKVNRVIKEGSRENILILGYPLNIKSDRLNITLIGEFSKSIVAEEQYYIYLIEKNK